MGGGGALEGGCVEKEEENWQPSPFSHFFTSVFLFVFIFLLLQYPHHLQTPTKDITT